MAGTNAIGAAALAGSQPLVAARRGGKGVVLIVGGSSGIGLALAEQFAHQGFDLLLVARSPDRLAVAADKLARRSTVAVATLALDATLPDAPGRVAATLQKQSTPLAYAVVTLGVWRGGPLLSADVEALRKTTEINVFAPHALMRTVVPLLQPRGGILFVGSLAGCLPLPQFSVYAASKAHLHAHVLALRQELAGSGRTACLLAPGIVATDFVASAQGIWTWLIALFASSPRAVAHAGVLGLQSNVPVIVPGVFWRLVWFGMRLQPAGLLALWTRGAVGVIERSKTRGPRSA